MADASVALLLCYGVEELKLSPTDTVRSVFAVPYG